MGCPPWEIEEGISRLIWRMIANAAEPADRIWRSLGRDGEA